MAVVARLLRGEPLELVARETIVSIAKLTEWRPFAGVRTSPRRVRGVMRENGLLAQHRVRRTETKSHDRTIITDKVNEMWGTDMTQTITIGEGRANVFVAVEHANSEIVGIHASRSANRFEAFAGAPGGASLLRSNRAQGGA